MDLEQGSNQGRWVTAAFSRVLPLKDSKIYVFLFLSILL